MQENVTKENPYPLKIEGQGELNRRSLFFTFFTGKRAVLSHDNAPDIFFTEIINCLKLV